MGIRVGDRLIGTKKFNQKYGLETGIIFIVKSWHGEVATIVSSDNRYELSAMFNWSEDFISLIDLLSMKIKPTRSNEEVGKTLSPNYHSDATSSEVIRNRTVCIKEGDKIRNIKDEYDISLGQLVYVNMIVPNSAYINYEIQPNTNIRYSIINHSWR